MMEQVAMEVIGLPPLHGHGLAVIEIGNVSVVFNSRVYGATLGVPEDEMDFPSVGVTTLAREQRETGCGLTSLKPGESKAPVEPSPRCTVTSHDEGYRWTNTLIGRQG